MGYDSGVDSGGAVLCCGGVSFGRGVDRGKWWMLCLDGLRVRGEGSAEEGPGADGIGTGNRERERERGMVMYVCIVRCTNLHNYTHRISE